MDAGRGEGVDSALVETVGYGGWQRCVRLVSGNFEALVTVEVGPRVIRFGEVGGPNALVEYPAQMGLTGGSEYRSYGGHRLWVAPEDAAVTYEPENEPVHAYEEGGWACFRASLGAQRLEKEVRVRWEGEALRLEHRVTNRGEEVRTLAPWVLTVMAAGGECLWPQPEPKSHKDALLPAAPLVLWHYTDMADPRWTWGARVARLRHDPEAERPQKVGALVTQGYAAYANHGSLFLKRFPALEGAVYPDYGCNFETFTRHDMLEVETLGPLVELEPGATVTHPETWYLVPSQTPPAEDAACAEWLEGLVATRPLLTD